MFSSTEEAMTYISEQRNNKKTKLDTGYCMHCEKDTEGVDVEGHTGIDSYSYFRCFTCGGTT